MNTCPGCTVEATAAGARAWPRRDQTITQSPETIFIREASCGLISTSDSAEYSLRSTADLPVRVLVCHCAEEPRPVSIAKGNSGVTGSGIGCGGAKRNFA